MAVQLNPKLKIQASKDDDLKPLWENKLFKELIK